jgi:hypothetical protein
LAVIQSEKFSEISVAGLFLEVFLEFGSLTVIRGRLLQHQLGKTSFHQKKNFKAENSCSRNPLKIRLLPKAMDNDYFLFEKSMLKAFAIEIERVNLRPLKEGTVLHCNFRLSKCC